jgi:nucleoside-diphosphate-sugar epimerase
MKIVVIGGSGLIGTKLVSRLRQNGHEVVAASPGLIARITGGDPDDEQVRLQIPQLFGAILVFRVARATVLREFRWDSIGAREFEAIRGMIQVNVDALNGASIGSDRP